MEFLVVDTRPLQNIFIEFRISSRLKWIPAGLKENKTVWLIKPLLLLLYFNAVESGNGLSGHMNSSFTAFGFRRA